MVNVDNIYLSRLFGLSVILSGMARGMEIKDGQEKLLKVEHGV
jgi:hypothetical protein